MAGRYPVISFYDYSLDPGTTISGSGWSASTPVTNLLIPRPQLGCITDGGVGTVTIMLSGLNTIGLVHLQNLIAPAGAHIAVTAGSYTSGTVSALPVNGGITYPPIELAYLGYPRFFVFPAPVMADAVTVTVDGTGLGPIGVGYISVSAIWQVPIGMKYGWGLTPKDLSTVNRVPYGSVYPTKQGKVRVINIGFDFLVQGGIYGEGAEDDHIFSVPLALAGINAKSMPFAIVPLPDDTDNLERHSVWGALSEDPPFTNPFFATWDLAFQLEQWI